jgi:hypothetical protein
MPEVPMPRSVAFWRRRRITTASPCSIGITETRMSTSLSVDADLDAAVLRQAFLGDVQVAENLDARNDGRLEALDLRRHRHFLQHAVDAVADAELVLERFEVNVRGAQFDGVASTWLTNRMIEASSAALSRLVSSSPSSSTTWNGASSSSVSMVSAPTPRRFFISRWMASGARARA